MVGWSAPSTQIGVPVLQAMTPVLHSVGFPVHAAPCVQATQLPVLQTPPGHELPVAMLPFSTHTGAPDEQLIAPVRHTFDGVHAAPAEHGLQAPALHTPPEQLVPLGLLLEFTQTAEPEPHSMLPL